MLSSNKTGVNPRIRSWKCTYLIELNVRKPLVVSISQRSKELRLYNLVWRLTISNPGLKALSSNASPGWTVRFFFGSYDRDFLKDGVKNYPMTPMSPLNSPTFFLSSHLLSVGLDSDIVGNLPSAWAIWCHTSSSAISQFSSVIFRGSVFAVFHFYREHCSGIIK